MSVQSSSKGKGWRVIHLLMYTILIALIAGLIYFNFENMEDQINHVADKKKAIAFNELPLNVQSFYVEQSEYAKLEEAYISQKNDLNQTRKDINELSIENVNLHEKLAQFESDTSQEKILVDKQAKQAKDFARCYDMYKGSYFIYPSCKKNIINYVNKHKDAKFFEITGIVDTQEFTLYKNLENNTFIYERLGVTQRAIKVLKKYTDAGLAKFRAMEASWVIKAHTKRKADTYNVLYKLTSKKGLRGVIVKAYE